MARNRMTLLKIVQLTLDALGSTPVNSISDSVEATQIAEEARVTYYDLMDRDEWPHLIGTIQLESVSDSNRPNYLKIPQDVTRIHDVRYEATQLGDPSTTDRQIEYLTPKGFLNLVQKSRGSNQDNVIQVTDFGGFDYYVIDDTPPMYWTSFDDEHVVFDSYDSAQEVTMSGSKSTIRAKILSDWTTADGFIPDMPDNMFGTFLAEVRASAHMFLKQTPSPKDEQRARRGIAKLRRQAAKVSEYDGRARYGRKRYRTYGSQDGVRGSINAALWP